jgi:hypothetical protein
VRRIFWTAIADGLASEEAAIAAGVSTAVDARWFRQNGGMPNLNLAPPSDRFLSLAEREEIALLFDIAASLTLPLVPLNAMTLPRRSGWV